MIEKGTYIQFRLWQVKDNRQTSIWAVETHSQSEQLGTVAWFGRWRTYAFHPDMRTVFEKKCLREIADFCERKTKEHRAANKALKGGSE